jgi:cbb3-type cytochrome oxidase maturation protein
MDVFIFLIPITIIIASIILAALIWSINNSQCDDLDQKGKSILFIEEKNIKGSKRK